MLENIRIVMIETSHPGNIGATARAMKNMGLTRLYLVKPTEFPSAVATARASSADDVLQHAVVCDSLAEAVVDCGMVIGTSSENRGRPLELLNARECGEFVMSLPEQDEIAIVFGTERSGLANEHFALCNRHVIITTNPDYDSLNLAQAVQVICYEIFMAANQANRANTKSHADYDRLTSNAEMQQFYDHLKQTLIDIDYLNPNVEKQLIPRLKRFFNRAAMEANEYNIFRGIFNAAQKNKKS